MSTKTCWPSDCNGMGMRPLPQRSTKDFLARSIRLTTLLAATSWSVGCATITPLPPPPPLDISVTILPTSGVVTLGNQLTFTATVKNSSDEAVSWSVSGVSGGNASLGTITVGGVYTAPQDLPNPASVQIVATSHADTPKSATATVQIQSDIGITLGSARVNPREEAARIRQPCMLRPQRRRRLHPSR
jgi:hypothetical protein